MEIGANSTSGDIAEDLSESESQAPLPASIVEVKRLARTKKSMRKQSSSRKSFEEKRWKAKKREEFISEEARKAWEVGKKLGLLSKVSDETMRSQIRILEKEDFEKARKGKKSVEAGVEDGN